MVVHAAVDAEGAAGRPRRAGAVTGGVSVVAQPPVPGLAGDVAVHLGLDLDPAVLGARLELPVGCGAAAPAFANDADVIRRGGCSGASSWKLKASPENGRIEVEAEVDSNQNGQTWKWRLIHNGSVSARGTSTTSGPSGSFEVRREVVNLDGADSIRFKARNPATDETCTGSLKF